MPSEKVTGQRQAKGKSDDELIPLLSPQFQWSEKRSDTKLVVVEQSYHYQRVTLPIWSVRHGAENLDRDAGRARTACRAAALFHEVEPSNLPPFTAIGSSEEIRNQSPCFVEVSDALVSSI